MEKIFRNGTHLCPYDLLCLYKFDIPQYKWCVYTDGVFA